MPNHITTYLQADREVLDSLRSPDGEVDFNTVIPYPEELRGLSAEFQVFYTQEEVDAYQKSQEEFLSGFGQGDQVFALTESAYRDLARKYGDALDWYSWNSVNWGTKWNAYDVKTQFSPVEFGIITERIFPDLVGELNVVKFNTAWAFPEPVLEALSAKFPEKLISYVYADEDLGANYGMGHYRGGFSFLSRSEHLGAGTEEARDFAAWVRYNQSYESLKVEWEE